MLLLFWFYCYFLLLAYFIILFGPKVKWNHFQSVALFSALCLIVHDFVNSSSATWIVADHCISSPCMLFFFSPSLSLSIHEYTWCVSDVRWIIKCVYGFPFDTRRCLRTEFLIVSHYCAKQLSSSFLVSRSRSVGVCARARRAHHRTQRKLLNILFFDNCFKHCSVRSVIFFYLLCSVRLVTKRALNLLVEQSHTYRSLKPSIQIRWQCFYVNIKCEQ